MLNVKFPSIGEYNYDSSEKVRNEFLSQDEIIAHDEEFWAPYDPFEPYDAFGPYESCESYEKWKEEFYKNTTEIKKPVPTKDPQNVPLKDPPLLAASKDPTEQGFHVIYHQVCVKN